MTTNGTAPDVPADANESCPGTNAEAAGRAAACAGCPNQQACATAPKGVDPDVVAVAERLRDVKHKILVLSGKGGVGKSTFASQLAYGLASDADKDVGLLDVDICGPSAPIMFHQEGQDVHKSNSGWQPVYVAENLAVMSIGFLLPNPDDAVVWRGPRKNGLIKQFLKDTEWGALDYLVVDAPPGTSDEHLSVVQYLKRAGVDGALIVTTPQEVAMADVRKELSFCKKVGIPVLGVVENMAGLSERCFGDEEEEEESGGGLGGAPRFVDERTGVDVTAAVRDAVSEKLGREFAERLRVEVDVFAPSRGGAIGKNRNVLERPMPDAETNEETVVGAPVGWRAALSPWTWTSPGTPPPAAAGPMRGKRFPSSSRCACVPRARHVRTTCATPSRCTSRTSAA